MKHYFYFIILCLSLSHSSVSFGQSDSLSYQAEAVHLNVQEYLDSIRPSDFSTWFKTKASRQDYKRLRDYKAQKEILIRVLTNNEVKFYYTKNYLDELRNFNSAIKEIFSKISPEDGYYAISESDREMLMDMTFNLPSLTYQRFTSVFGRGYNRLYGVQEASESPNQLKISNSSKENLLLFLQQQEESLGKDLKTFETLKKNIEIAKAVFK